MNVTLPEKDKGIKRRIMIYTAILTVCVIAIGIAIYQFFADEKLGVILGITQTEDEEYERLKSQFNNLFTNKLDVISNTISPKKIKDEKNLVYIDYEKEEKVQNDYEINIHIPYINIDDDLAKNYNEDIKETFQKPAEVVLETKNRNIIFTVNYMAALENDVLTVILFANYKEGNSAQRTVVKTYNYNLKNNSEFTLDECMNMLSISEDTFKYRVKKEIEKAQDQSEKLRELGYNIFARDITSDIYKKENTNQFFIYNGHLYLVYPYGNTNSTSEMDIVII